MLVKIRTEIAGIEQVHTPAQQAQVKELLLQFAARHKYSTDKSEVFETNRPYALVDELQEIGVEAEVDVDGE